VLGLAIACAVYFVTDPGHGVYEKEAEDASWLEVLKVLSLFSAIGVISFRILSD
jgi:hypothetical protein